MRMTFRWYGENDDKITLQQIDQIPVWTVSSALYSTFLLAKYGQ